MITTFKIFENLDKPEVGNYIIANNISIGNWSTNSDIFLKNNR